MEWTPHWGPNPICRLLIGWVELLSLLSWPYFGGQLVVVVQARKLHNSHATSRLRPDTHHLQNGLHKEIPRTNTTTGRHSRGRLVPGRFRVSWNGDLEWPAGYRSSFVVAISPQRIPDDHYVIYGALRSGPNARIFTNDFLSNNVFKLSYKFYDWLRSVRIECAVEDANSIVVSWPREDWPKLSIFAKLNDLVVSVSAQVQSVCSEDQPELVHTVRRHQDGFGEEMGLCLQERLRVIFYQ